MGVPVPSDGDSEIERKFFAGYNEIERQLFGDDSDSDTSEPFVETETGFLSELASEYGLPSGTPDHGAAGSSSDQSGIDSEDSVGDGETFYDAMSTDGAGSGELPPLPGRSGPRPPGSPFWQQPEPLIQRLHPGNVARLFPQPPPPQAGPSGTSRDDSSSRTAGRRGHVRSRTSSSEPGQKKGDATRSSFRRALSGLPPHQAIHLGRKKDWSSSVPVDPPGREEKEIPFVQRHRVDPTAFLPRISKIFKRRKRKIRDEEDSKDSVAGGGGTKSRRGTITGNRPWPPPGRPSDDPNYRGPRALPEGKGPAYPPEPGPYKWRPRPLTLEDFETKKETRKRRQAEAKARAARARAKRHLPTDLRKTTYIRRPRQIRREVAQVRAASEEEFKYRRRGATVDLKPRLQTIHEGKSLNIIRRRGDRRSRATDRRDAEPDPNDPLVSWYFPRKSPDYWAMMDDVAKMFEDLHMQEVSLKHFQRPIDYCTVLLSLSNVVFAEIYQTLKEKVTDGTYRIEWGVSGRTGVKLYLSAYSREHMFIAKSLLHKVSLQVDYAKKESPMVIRDYVRIIEPHERGLVHDKLKTWGRVPDGQFRTYTDIDSPTVVHEIGISETRRELYNRCKRYLEEVPSINLALAIKLDSTECEWAELLLLARRPHKDRIITVHNWVRFWGHGAVTGGELCYYASDFLEIEDRSKIPWRHMRPLTFLDEPR